MKFYKKLDLYLLENFPLLWHSKIQLLLFIGLILNCVFYFIGYQFATVEHLQENNILRYYFESPIYYHILIIICSLTIWAVLFFRNNALKSNYKTQKFYITKLILLLTIGFFGLTLPFISFQKGILQATRNYENVEVLNKEIATYNKARFFLVTSPNDFRFEYASFPLALYNYENVEDDKNPQEDRFQTGISKWKDSLYIPAKHPENTFEIDEKKIQFYKEDYKILWENKCDSEGENYITSILNPSKIKSTDYYSCAHFSGELLDEIQAEIKSDNHYYRRTSSATGNLFSEKVYNIIQTNDTKAVYSLLHKFKSILTKHSIKTNFSVPNYITYLVANNYKADEIQLYTEKPYNSEQRTPNFPNSNIYDSKQAKAYYFEKSELDQLYDNCAVANKYLFDFKVFWFLFFVSFIASIIVIGFEVFPIIQLFISLAIFGALIIGNVIIQLLVQYSRRYYNVYVDREYYAIVHLVLFLLLYLVLAILSNRWKGKKWLTTQLTLFGLFTVGGILPALYVLFDKLFSYEKYSPCNVIDHIHSFWFSLIQPIPITLSIMLCLIVFTRVLKTYLSKKE